MINTNINTLLDREKEKYNNGSINADSYLEIRKLLIRLRDIEQITNKYCRKYESYRNANNHHS